MASVNVLVRPFRDYAMAPVESKISECSYVGVRKAAEKKGNLTEGSELEPEDSPLENKFLVLYDDPSTMAYDNRVLYLSRHGESEFNLFGRIGGNSPLSSQGEKYALNLAGYFENLSIDGLEVWTSQLRRTQQTAFHIKGLKVPVEELNEIESGEYDGLTYEEIAENHPVEFASRDQDKLRYRYPGGESYLDVCWRLCKILGTMNRSSNLLVISHQAVIRCVLAYLMKWRVEDIPYVKVPLHTIMKVTFDGTKNVMESKHLNVECVDTYRPKPSNCDNDRGLSEALQTVPLHL